MEVLNIKIAGQRYRLKAKTRFLLVEDQKEIQMALGKDLRRLGFTGDIFWCDEIKDAISAVQSLSIDIILLDINLKEGENGINLLKALKKFKIDIPVIMVSSGDDIKDIMEAIKYGADEFIVKPWDRETLINKIAYSISI